MSVVRNRISLMQGALWGMFIGDALAMPVHWYFDREALRRDYGLVTSFVDPKILIPTAKCGSTFLTLSI